MKTIHLIRHGQAQAGTDNYDRLSAVGKTQADVLGYHLDQPEQETLNVWSGSLTRQLQTARIAHKLDDDHAALPQQHHGLNEYHHKAVHQRYDTRAHHTRDGSSLTHDVALDMTLDVYTHIISSWINDHEAINDTSFESWHEFQNRAMGALNDIINNSTADVVFAYSSGGTISSIIGQLEALGPSEIATLIWDMKNTSITTLVANAGTLEISGRNRVDHLSEKHENLITAI